MPESVLGITVLVTGAWAVSALAVLVARTLAWGRPSYFSRPAASAARGVAYAFGPGMSPRAKESVREHPGAWLEGTGYHVGVFAAIGMAAIAVAGIHPVGAWLLPLRLLLASGAICGALLLVRRASSPALRTLSCPDDYIANLLGTSLAVLALATTFSAAWRPAFLLAACGLFLYAPLGKIRHCLLFFTTRFFLAVHYGRRGTFPPGS